MGGRSSDSSGERLSQSHGVVFALGAKSLMPVRTGDGLTRRNLFHGFFDRDSLAFRRQYVWFS